MGGGRFDSSSYYDSAATRAATGVKDFAYTATAKTVHDTLKPKRIKDKVFATLESRDSAEHPNSNAIIVCFDVTGSNYSRAVQAQKSVPGLMSLLEKYVADPQISIAANDDYYTSQEDCFQMSEFESDNRVDDHIRNLYLVGRGGSNDGESYDLMLYAAAYKTSIDCFEKRGKKGYLFLYADEPIFDEVRKDQVLAVFGDVIDKDIPIARMIEIVREKWEVFILFPEGGYERARKKYMTLFGDDCVITVQHPDKISEVIGATIGVCEGKVDTLGAVVDLTSVGVSPSVATSIVGSLTVLENKRAVGKYSGELEMGGSGANRL